MLPRIDLLFALMLALAGCAPLPARPVTTVSATQEAQATAVPVPTVVPTADPNALPTADELAGWVLTTDEIKYIDSFRFSKANRIPLAQRELFALVEQYREDPMVLTNNQWRKEAIDVSGRLERMFMHFSGQSPTDRFSPFANKVTDMLKHYAVASGLVQQAVDQNDGAKVEEAVREVAAAVSLSVAIDTAFTALVGPPED